jgi:hypothetical protein
MSKSSKAGSVGGLVVRMYSLARRAMPLGFELGSDYQRYRYGLRPKSMQRCFCTMRGHTNRKTVSSERTARFIFGAEDSQMEAKFAVGDRVDQSPRDRFVGTVKAIYMTREGEVRSAVDMEGHGTLRLFSEHTIVAHIISSHEDVSDEQHSRLPRN